MAKITPSLKERVKRIAFKLSKNRTDFDDCFSHGLEKICEMQDGHTESYYAQRSYRKMQDYLRKQRVYYSRHFCIISEMDKAIALKQKVPNYEEIDYDYNVEVDVIQDRFLNGKEV